MWGTRGKLERRHSGRNRIFKADFERLVVCLYQPKNLVHANVRRLANLILAHFDAVAGTTRNRSERSSYLVEQVHRATVEKPQLVT